MRSPAATLSVTCQSVRRWKKNAATSAPVEVCTGSNAGIQRNRPACTGVSPPLVPAIAHRFDAMEKLVRVVPNAGASNCGIVGVQKLEFTTLSPPQRKRATGPITSRDNLSGTPAFCGAFFAASALYSVQWPNIIFPGWKI